MTKPNDGGPAFPSHEPWEKWDEVRAQYRTVTDPHGGMSLRDYFAAQALAMMTPQIALLGPPLDGTPSDEWLARCAYQIADAMLAERAK
jgi:hypothetical protein